MKLTKYLMVALSGLLLTACSDDGKINTDSSATVELANATMKVKENVGTFYVPLKLTGTTNGEVKVTVEVSEYSASPAQEDVHYYLVSKTVVIPNDSAQVSLEFLAVNDMDLNDDRVFTVTITKVEGAKLGAQTTTEVTIGDDDGLFYEAIQGAWKWYSTSYYGGADNWDVNLVGVPEGDEGYEETMYLSGWMGYNWVIAEVEYSYDEVNNKINLNFPYGQIIATDVNFTGLGVCDVGLFGVNGGYLDEDGGLTATVNDDLRSIEFDPLADVIFYVLQGNEGMGAWDRINTISMSR